MKIIIKNLLMFTFIIIMFIFLLTDSQACINLASRGLLLWFERMVPTLFPFMVLSGFLVKTGLSKIFGKMAGLFLRILFPLPSPMLYAIFMGFLCGFPMGAKVIRDLISEKEITEKEGEYLLTFTNNIGPLYLLGYASLLLNWQTPFKYLCLFYSIPLLYGFFLLHLTSYRNLLHDDCYDGKNSTKQPKRSSPDNKVPLLNIHHSLIHKTASPRDYRASFYIKSLFHSIHNSLDQITLLGGCMIIFNCLQIFPIKLKEILAFFVTKNNIIALLSGVLCSFTEIGGGLSELKTLTSQPAIVPLTLSLLTFGGFCCIFQTYTILENTGLSIKKYIFHKIIQSLLMFFVVWTIHSHFYP